MPTMNLKQDYRYTDGRLYRRGEGRTVPDGFEQWLNGPQPDAASALPKDFPAQELLSQRYGSVQAVKSATDEELLGVEGIGPARLREIRAYRA